jgi:hypothetical protein
VDLRNWAQTYYGDVNRFLDALDEPALKGDVSDAVGEELRGAAGAHVFHPDAR